MTTGHQIEPKIFQMRKRPKKTASNARITREPFGDKPTKILAIPTFIDDYNHYMGGVDQANQLRAAFTTHFSRNQKEFFPGAFWAIDLAVYNSYKLHLALNGSKTSKTGKRDPQQHRKWIEDLVDLLFQVDSDEFGEDIDSKPYPKYKYQEVSTGPKREGKEAFLRTINDLKNHLYIEKSRKERGYCFFCVERSSKKTEENGNSADFLLFPTFSLKKVLESEISEKTKSKRKRNRGKYTKGWCENCQKFICEGCWRLYH